MAPRLHERVACVTGASSGLGRAIALAFAAEGAFVVCSDLQPQARSTAPSQESATATHDVIVQQGGKAVFVKADVRLEDQVAALIAETVKGFGRLDIMVNNAGISGFDPKKPEGCRVHETQVENFDLVMEINVRGVFLGCKHALAQFLNQEPLQPNSRGDRTRGKIINMASIVGLISLDATPGYTTSKHAVIGLTKQIAGDYALDKIHCNAICPGFTETALISHLQDDQDGLAAVKAAHPWGALGQAEDIAKAAVFLASDDASWVTGHPLVVDGGYIAK